MDTTLKNKREHQILTAALAVAVEKGYSDSRIDDIVQNSKLSKGTIYWYYKSKKDVYLALVDYWFKQYSSEVLSQIEKNNLHPRNLLIFFNIL